MPLKQRFAHWFSLPRFSNNSSKY